MCLSFIPGMMPRIQPKLPCMHKTSPTLAASWANVLDVGPIHSQRWSIAFSYLIISSAQIRQWEVFTFFSGCVIFLAREKQGWAHFISICEFHESAANRSTPNATRWLGIVSMLGRHFLPSMMFVAHYYLTSVFHLFNANQCQGHRGSVQNIAIRWKKRILQAANLDV